MKSFLKHEGGATAIEYAFIIAAVVLVMLAGLILLGDSVGSSYNNTATKVGAKL